MESCYRHPGVETGVSCQRCDRFICPECSTPGAVGFLCPEDAKETIKIRRPAFQQSLTSRAPVTMTLIGINVTVYIFQMLGFPIIDMLAFMRVGQGIEYGSPLRAFTSAFVHSQSMITHILFNMYSLFVLGTLLEPMLGKLKFALLYLMAIFGGSIGFFLFGDLGAVVVGASGAVFGLMGAYLIYLRALRLDTTQIAIILVINVVVSFLPGIAWQAHFGGFIVGVLVALAYTRFSRSDQKTLLIGSIAVLVVALIGLWIYGNQIMPPVY